MGYIIHVLCNRSLVRNTKCHINTLFIHILDQYNIIHIISKPSWILVNNYGNRPLYDADYFVVFVLLLKFGIKQKTNICNNFCVYIFVCTSWNNNAYIWRILPNTVLPIHPTNTKDSIYHSYLIWIFQDLWNQFQIYIYWRHGITKFIVNINPIN